MKLETNISVSDVRITLEFMLDMPSWWGGRTTNLKDPGAHIMPAEGILKYPSFAAIVKQMQEWHSKRSAEWSTFPSSILNHALETTSSPSIAPKVPPPEWVHALPEPILRVMKEVYKGIELDLRTIATMGIRTVIDMVLVDLVGDVGGFERKLKELVAQGLRRRHRS